MKATALEDILKKPFQTILITGGDSDTLFENIKSFYVKEMSQVSTHSDIADYKVDTVSIDLAREIKEWCEIMPQYRDDKILILYPELFPSVSQNALLKTIEEPSGKTKVILIVKHEALVLPTIRSRSVVYRFSKESKEYDNTFLLLKPQERLSHPFVLSLLKTGAQKPPKEEVNAFFETIVSAVTHARYSELERREAFHVLKTVTPYINDQGASIKMLVEYLCIQLPTFNG